MRERRVEIEAYYWLYLVSVTLLLSSALDPQFFDHRNKVDFLNIFCIFLFASVFYRHFRSLEG